jgi:lipopolysaccharide/colanic/teichoic acid biosynthesis glycosyltransferase
MAAIAVLIRLTMGRPVLFAQVRPGQHGRPFRLYKFRTMRPLKEGEEEGISDAQRLTFLGKLLRRTSLDELPQLANVLKGEMSLVGPRPLLMHYMDLYSAEQARRHEVKPGLTGWTQINGRNAPSWEERLAMDVWYVDHMSMRLDLEILLKTVSRLFSGEGVAQEGRATVDYFKGSREETSDE